MCHLTKVKDSPPVAYPWDGPTVNVVVGPDATTIAVHKYLLCTFSKNFQAALEGCFQEAGSHILILDDEDVHTFRIFVRWLYTGKLLVKEERNDSRRVTQAEAIKLWVFGDKRDITVLRNAAINAWRQDAVISRRIKPNHDLIYENTVPGASLRSMYVEAICCVCDSSIFEPANAVNLPMEFLVDVHRNMSATQQGRRRSWFSPDFQFGCRFHDHSNGDDHSAVDYEDEWHPGWYLSSDQPIGTSGYLHALPPMISESAS